MEKMIVIVNFILAIGIVMLLVTTVIDILLKSVMMKRRKEHMNYLMDKLIALQSEIRPEIKSLQEDYQIELWNDSFSRIAKSLNTLGQSMTIPYVFVKGAKFEISEYFSNVEHIRCALEEIVENKNKQQPAIVVDMDAIRKSVGENSL